MTQERAGAGRVGRMGTVAWIVLAIIGLIAVAVVLREQAPRPSSPAKDRQAAEQAARYLTALIGPKKRTAFDPVVEDGETEEPVSKFGGRPWLAEGTAWPVCPGCERPMGFFVQLDVASLPDGSGASGAGLIQLFMCTVTDDMEDICLGSWEHGAQSSHVRLVDTGQPGANAKATGEVFPPRRIVRWTPMDDHPDYDDLGMADIEVTEELEAAWELAADEVLTPKNHEGDKLAGWPYWVQNPEYARCRQCNKLMNVVFQIDSDDNVPYMFGDAGAGHVSQCPDHPHVLVFGWACY